MKLWWSLVLSVCLCSWFAIVPPFLFGASGRLNNTGLGWVRVRGEGSHVGRPSSRNVIRAREAARIEAERALRRVVDSLAFDCSQTIGDVFLDRDWNDEFIHGLRSLIRRARIVEEGRKGHRSYFVVLEFDLENLLKILPGDDENFLSSVARFQETLPQRYVDTSRERAVGE